MYKQLDIWPFTDPWEGQLGMNFLNDASLLSQHFSRLPSPKPSTHDLPSIQS